MARYEVVEARQWRNLRTGQTASIHGALPYFNAEQKQDWEMVTVGWTIYDVRLNTYGIGRAPWKTRAEAEEWVKAATPIPPLAPTGYLVLSALGMKTRRVAVNDAHQIERIWAAWRTDNDLGYHDLKADSGNLVDSTGKVVARISYNGRIWDADDRLIFDPADISPVPSKPAVRQVVG